MNKLCITVSVIVLSSVGWWLGSYVGFMTAFILSSIGSVLGVYVGWRISQALLD